MHHAFYWNIEWLQLLKSFSCLEDTYANQLRLRKELFWLVSHWWRPGLPTFLMQSCRPFLTYSSGDAIWSKYLKCLKFNTNFAFKYSWNTMIEENTILKWFWVEMHFLSWQLDFYLIGVSTMLHFDFNYN